MTRADRKRISTGQSSPSGACKSLVYISHSGMLITLLCVRRSTKGLKAELASRLQEAVDATNSDAPAPPMDNAPAQEPDKSETPPELQPEKAAAPEEAQQNGEESHEAAEKPPATNGHAALAPAQAPEAEQHQKDGSPAAAESEAIVDKQAETSEALLKHDFERVDAVMGVFLS